MTTHIFNFDNIISTNRSPKKLGDYDYILDISYNIFYDISNNIVYDDKKIIFYKLAYYKNYLISCVNYVSIASYKGNFVYLYLINEYIKNIPLWKVGFTTDEQERNKTNHNNQRAIN